VEAAQKAVIEAEAKKKADEECLEKLNKKESKLRNDSTVLSAATQVAAEQVIVASTKIYYVKREVEEAKRVSADAWDHVHQRNEELKAEIEKSKEIIEEAVATIEKAVAERHEINCEMSFKVKAANDAKAQAENDLFCAKQEESDASVSAAAAAEAVRLALLAQEEADKRYKEAQKLVETMLPLVYDKSSKLNDTISTAKKTNKAANEVVQKAVQESAKIEKEATAKVEKTNAEKMKAEEIARKLDDDKMHKEAKALVAEKLARMAVESKEKTINDAKKVENKIEKSGDRRKELEESLLNDRAQLKERKRIVLERLDTVTKLRRELQMSAVVNSIDN